MEELRRSSVVLSAGGCFPSSFLVKTSRILLHPSPDPDADPDPDPDLVFLFSFPNIPGSDLVFEEDESVISVRILEV